MAQTTLEVGEDERVQQCDCCPAASSVGHGFVYRGDSPFAVYYAGWSAAHRERGVTLAIAIGEWHQGSNVGQRTCVGIAAYEGEHDILFTFINPEASPWSNTSLLGPMIRRDEALSHPMRAEFLSVAEEIVRSHPAVHRFLRA